MYRFQGLALPEEVQESIDRYVKHGIPTGGFLEACIDNDLKEACGRADLTNITKLPVIVAYLYNECPAACWGYPGAFREWLTKKMEERKLRDRQEKDMRATTTNARPAKADREGDRPK